MTSRPLPILRFIPAFLFLLLLTVTYVIIITHGSFDLTQNEPLSSTYTSMLDHFKVGSFGVDLKDVRFEAFYSNGQITTYQGPFLALLRAFFELFFSRSDKDWARISCLLSACLTVFFLGLCSLEIGCFQRKNRFALVLGICLLFSFAFGSPILFLLSNAYLYNEPVLWGMTWNSIFFWAYLKLLNVRTTRLFFLFLSLMGTSAGFALLSRVSFGASLSITLLLTVFILLYSGENAFSRLADANILKVKKTLSVLSPFSLRKRAGLVFLSLLPFLFLLGITLFINQGRWGTPFSFMPAIKNGEFLQANKIDLNPRGIRLLKNGAFNLRRLPFGIEYYFFPDKGVMRDHSPFLQFQTKEFLFAENAETYDYIEGSRIPFSINSPFIFLLGFIGLLLFLRFSWNKISSNLDTALVLGPCAQVLVLTTLSSVALRYQLDLLPLFVVGCFFSMIFLIHYEEKISKTSKRFLMGSLVGLTVIGIYCASTTMLLTKLWCWATPHQARQTVFSLLDLPANDPLRQNVLLLYNQRHLIK